MKRQQAEVDGIGTLTTCSQSIHYHHKVVVMNGANLGES